MKRRVVSVFGVILVVLACAKNPITGKQSFVLTSEAEEAQLGDEAYRQTLAKYPQSTNREWTRLIVRVGENIQRVANKPDFKWEFKLLESKEANAFCLPGGKIAFFTGMMKYFENEAQIAAVMGHEVGHATGRHAGQRITLQMGTEIGFQALIAFLGGDSMSMEKKLLLSALGLGTQVGAVLPFSRSHETEADYMGVLYMAMAGYDPHAAVTFWQNFAKQSAGPPEFLSTHPKAENRVKELEAKMPEAMERYNKARPQFGMGERVPKR